MEDFFLDFLNIMVFILLIEFKEIVIVINIKNNRVEIVLIIDSEGVIYLIVIKLSLNINYIIYE